jgi:predicted Zn finger-like uncharacterized protein
MKFLCDSCGTKYAISDERVRGRVLKIRCKKCDFVITVREDVQAAAAAVALPSDDEIGRALDAAQGEKTTVGDLDSVLAKTHLPDAADWYVSFDGEQEGPFDLARAMDRVRKEATSGKEAHAWRPGFMVWLPVEEVPELAPALLTGKPPALRRAPVRASTPTPIAARGSGAVGAQIAKDPSGPRAALAVSAGARAPQRPATPGLASRASAGAARPATPASAVAPVSMDARKPATPLAGPATSTGLPSRNLNGSGPSSSKPAAPLFAANAAVAPKETAPAADPFSVPTIDPGAPLDDDGDDDDKDAAPELPISNEASGLVSLAHLMAATTGNPTGPVMRNGHTSPVRKLPTPAAEPITALDPPGADNSVAVPVVVVAGAAPKGTSPLFKWAALVALIACVGLGGGVWYLLTHRPPPDTIIVTEPRRQTDDTPITVTDPVTGKQTVVAADPKRPSAPKKAAAPAPRPAAPTKAGGGDGLSGSQRALADLYKDDGDKATPHLNAGAGSHAGGGGQVSQSAILAVVTQNRRALNLCYERVLKHDQSLKQGRVMVQVSVGISGRVTSVVIPEAQYAQSELGQCFTQAVKRWTFPTSDSPYSTEFPFILQAQ